MLKVFKILNLLENEMKSPPISKSIVKSKTEVLLFASVKSAKIRFNSFLQKLLEYANV